MYNKVIMIGRLTAQPELVTTSNEKSVTRVTLAVNRRFKSQMVSVRLILFQLWFGDV